MHQNETGCIHRKLGLQKMGYLAMYPSLLGWKPYCNPADIAAVKCSDYDANIPILTVKPKCDPTPNPDPSPSLSHKQKVDPKPVSQHSYTSTALWPTSLHSAHRTAL